MQKVAVILLAVVALAIAAPKPQDDGPMPYDFNWEVNDPNTDPNGIYFGQKEAANEVGRVDGEYYVWLADGRLMTVTYYVDGESGFVPTITYSEDYNPFRRRR